MPGLSTNGLPLATLPLTGLERIAVDTYFPNGTAPQTEAIPLNQLSTLGFGAAIPLVDAATTTLDASTGSSFTDTLGGNRTFVFNNPSPGQEIVLELKQDATGSRTVTWPASVSWAGGTAPTLTTTAAAVDVLRFTWNATAGKWRGETVGKAFA